VFTHARLISLEPGRLECGVAQGTARRHGGVPKSTVVSWMESLGSRLLDLGPAFHTFNWPKGK
jgi:hypothetical protein